MTLVILKNRCAIPVSGDIVQWKDDYLKIYANTSKHQYIYSYFSPLFT